MKDNIQILITGDFCPINRIEPLAVKGEIEAIYNDFLPYIQDADWALTNLECPLLKDGNPIQKTGPALKADPAVIRAISAAGFSAVTLANNHIMDYGRKGAQMTKEVCEQVGVSTVGLGHNLTEARKPLIRNIEGKVFAIINCSENEWSTTLNGEMGGNPLNPVYNYYDIQEARRSADFVIVIVHGGHEMYSLPSPRMKEIYRFFIDAGADAVIGHHPHCFSGFEIYKGKPVFYSLGNFIFDLNKPEKITSWNLGFAVLLSFSAEEINFEIIPYKQNGKEPGLRLLTAEESVAFDAQLKDLNSVIEDDSRLGKNFDNFCALHEKMYEGFLQPYTNKYLHALRNRKIIRSIWRGKKRLLLFNLIRCEAHRDILLKLLNK